LIIKAIEIEDPIDSTDEKLVELKKLRKDVNKTDLSAEKLN
jgi:hypothetical protein